MSDNITTFKIRHFQFIGLIQVAAANIKNARADKEGG
jgi:hypothetical protein